MTIAPSTTHVARAVHEITPPMQRPKHMANVAAKIRPFQRVEDLCWALLAKLSIATGEGWILDAIGRIVGRGRNGLSDDLYRVMLRVQILINRSNGSIPELLNILRTAVNDPAWSFRATLGDASIEIAGFGPLVTGMTPLLWSFLKDAKAAGVGLEYQGWLEPSGATNNDGLALWANDIDPEVNGSPLAEGWANDTDTNRDDGGTDDGGIFAWDL